MYKKLQYIFVTLTVQRLSAFVRVMDSTRSYTKFNEVHYTNSSRHIKWWLKLKGWLLLAALDLCETRIYITCLMVI